MAKKTSWGSVVVMVLLWGGIVKGCLAFREYNAAEEAKTAAVPKEPKAMSDVRDAGLDPKLVAQEKKREAAEEREREAFFEKGRAAGVIHKLEFRDSAGEAMVHPGLFMSLPMDAKRGFCATLLASAKFRSPRADLAVVSDYRTEKRIGVCSSYASFELED